MYQLASSVTNLGKGNAASAQHDVGQGRPQGWLMATQQRPPQPDKRAEKWQCCSVVQRKCQEYRQIRLEWRVHSGGAYRKSEGYHIDRDQEGKSKRRQAPHCTSDWHHKQCKKQLYGIRHPVLKQLDDPAPPLVPTVLQAGPKNLSSSESGDVIFAMLSCSFTTLSSCVACWSSRSARSAPPRHFRCQSTSRFCFQKSPMRAAPVKAGK